MIAGGVIGRDTAATYAGAGNGSNSKVEKLETLKSVIDDINDLKNVKSRTGGAVGGEDKKYTSCSVVEATEAYVTSESYTSAIQGRDGYEASSRLDFSRTLELYFTEKASYYVSTLRMASKSSYKYSRINNNGYQSKSTKSTLNMKVEFYISEDITMFCVRDMNYGFKEVYEDREDTDKSYTHTERDTDDGRMYTVMKEYRNRWVDCTEEPYIATGLLEIDSGNARALSSFAYLIEKSEASENSYFKKSGKVYTLKKDEMLDFFGLSGIKDIDIKGSCTIDLGTRTQPEISYTLSSDYTSKQSGNDYTERYSFIDDGYVFKNINNTVVKKPSMETVSIKTLIERCEEMEDK